MSVPTAVTERVPWAVLGGYRGSIAHGTYEPNSEPESIDDKDLMYVVVPSDSYYTGIDNFGSKGTIEFQHEDWDVVAYEARKMISLLLKGNPNVLSLLWLPDERYVLRSRAGDHLIENREAFVSKQVYHSFNGYAYGQLHRMTHGANLGYMGAKRKGLVERFGYDTKNAAHLIRLLRMGIEFLNEGQLYVERRDARQLLEIKHGEWSLDLVKAEADHLFKRAEEAYDRSTLPAQPDWKRANLTCITIVGLAWQTENARTGRATSPWDEIKTGG